MFLCRWKKLRAIALSVACVCLGVIPQVFSLDPLTSPDIHPNLLPGTYHRVIGTVRHTITFNKDGSFSGKAWNARNEIDDEYEGRWSIQNGYGLDTTLRYVFKKSRKIAAGTEDEDYVVVLNKKYLSIIPKNARTTVARVWWRAAEKEPAKEADSAGAAK